MFPYAYIFDDQEAIVEATRQDWFDNDAPDLIVVQTEDAEIEYQMNGATNLILELYGYSGQPLADKYDRTKDG